MKPSGAVNIVALVAEMGKAVVRALEKEKGDILVFMPGVAHIRRCDLDPQIRRSIYDISTGRACPQVCYKSLYL